jgi:hypothetical protein
MTDRIDRELLLPASPEEVWAVLTSDGWLADELELMLEPGGEARFTSGDEVRTGWVEEAVVPGPGDRVARLTFWWSLPDEPASRVELVLEALEAEGERLTRVRVSETRPLEILDLVGIPLPGSGGARYGPALLAA